MNELNVLVGPPQCWFCGSTRPLVWTPQRHRLRGGTTDPDNLIRSCRGCIRARGIAAIAEYREVVRRVLVQNEIRRPDLDFRFFGEGGAPYQMPAVPRGRPRNDGTLPRTRSRAGYACSCGKWILADRIPGHIAKCRTLPR